jgi:dihydropteroate synthase
VFARQSYTIQLPGRDPLQLGARTVIMGILNITPDSFSDGGLRFDPARAIEDGLRMLDEGADILDVGGESTRPGAEPLAAEEELRRVLPVVEHLAERGAVVSIDTYKSVVARAAIEHGAVVVNDVHALTADPGLAGVVAESGVAVVLMHNRGSSRDMYREAVYADVVRDVTHELAGAIARVSDAGIRRESIIVDPGIGFAKRAAHSYELLARLESLATLNRPILAGPSRKSFLRDALGERPPAGREWGTAAAVAASVLAGAHIVRVHDVPAMTDVVRVIDRIRAAAPFDPPFR